MRKRSANNVVEINGRLYDAKTGLPAQTPITKDPTQHKVIDGFVKNKQTSRPKPTPAKTQHANTKRSETLHRNSLPKPEIKQHPKTHTVQKKTASVPHTRSKRAQEVSLSQQVQKFHPKSLQTNHTPASVEPSSSTQQSQTQNATQKPHMTAASHAATHAAESVQAQSKNSVLQKFRIAMTRRPRLLSITVTAIVLLIIGGYVTYLNIPNIALKVAAREAGFEANMPGYKPAGYSFAGPVSYEQGRITLRYSTGNEDTDFSITERQTNWDSQSLLDNFVVSEADLYQTYRERGLTIYVFNGSEATWVNGGVWYSIEGSARLNAEQLIRIATSL